MKKILLLFILTYASSCVSKLKYDETASKKTKYLEASISYPSGNHDCVKDPILGMNLSCDHFVLKIKNNSSKDYFVDWNNTYYLRNGQSSGGFYFAGIIIKDRNNPKSDDVILPKTTLNKVIYPNILTEFYSNQLTNAVDWKKNGFPLGNNGIYLTIKDKKGRKTIIKLELNLSE